MNLDNVVLVRAMSHLPLNGELIPSCEGKRLVFEKTSDFSDYIQELIEKELERKLGRPLVLYYESPDALLRDKMLEEYRILTGAYYTSSLSFSLNGIAPDDNTCNFSVLPLAVIDPIKNHTDANFVNVDVIDTTIKGRRQVSSDAILVINEEFFNSLSDEIKTNLANYYKIEFCGSNLKEGIDATLKKYNYPSLPLKQEREEDNIGECPERESMIGFENSFAKSVGASRLRLQQFYTCEIFAVDIDQLAHEKVGMDFYNNLIINEYYRHQLYNFLIAKAESFGIDVTDEEKYYIFTEYINGIEAMKKITSELIDAYGGLLNFKAFIKEYNEYAMNNYLTNDQIIALKGDTRK